MRIFIVEDNKLYADSLAQGLRINPNNEIRHFETGKQFLDHLGEEPDCVLLDYRLPDLSGAQLMARIHEYKPRIPVLIVSGQEDVSVATDLLRDGAYDYLVKDENTLDRVIKVVENLSEKLQLEQDLAQLRAELKAHYRFENILGFSPALKEAQRLVQKAVLTPINLLLTGESGTGKHLLAHTVHHQSSGDKPLLSFNCSAISEHAIAKVLLGLEPGSSDASRKEIEALLSVAQGGTLVLEEICQLSSADQAKLLRLLKDSVFFPHGLAKPVEWKCRIMITSTEDLVKAVQEGRFSAELYHALAGLKIHLPPLRERGQDKLLLAKHYLDEYRRENRLESLEISAEAMDRIMNYTWPGNVRELKSVMELAAVLADNRSVLEKDLNFSPIRNEMDNLVSEGISLKEYNRRLIQHYLIRNQNNVLKVARKLEVGKSTLYRMIKNKELSIN